MKKVQAVSLCLILALSLTSCGGQGRESAAAVTENAIKAVQSADLDAMRAYWGDDEFEAEDSSSEDDTYSEDMIKLIASGLTYNIVSSEEDENAGTATVTVEFTNVNMSKIMASYISEIFSIVMEYAFLPEDQQPSEEELNQVYLEKFSELMEQNGNETITTTVDVSLSLVDDKWEINTDETIVDAMLGGMYSYANSLSEIFS